MKLHFKGNNPQKSILNEIQLQKNLLDEATEFIKKIEEGNQQIEISNELKQNNLGQALISMQKQLLQIAEQEKERTWINTGLAKFSDILRNKQSLELKELANEILVNIIKYINANQGGLFVMENDPIEGEYLRMIACYAYDRKKYIDKRINLGEGLTGQCAIEKQSIYLTEIPENYIEITSGLGKATPNVIFISPLIINEKIFGVLELASFDKIPQFKIDFIEKLSENIASSIKNVKDNEQTIRLLNESQGQAEELRAQEEEMRQNMEEMLASQEEMARKNEEIASASSESISIIKGIDSTMATIEFTPEGVVTHANDNFLKSFQCHLQDIVGRHHRLFVPKEIVESEEYKVFWSNLAAGIPNSGIFKRVNSKKETIWLNAIYNPILRADGSVSKVVKFATDITEQLELLSETKGILNGINATMATIEFTPNGLINHANDNFLNTMLYTLDEIKGKHHRIFVTKEQLESDDYKKFWQRLAAGESIKGIFNRINSRGETVWLNAIYNPITNAEGRVKKVIKFAIDITKEKQKEEEIQQLLEESRAQEEEIRQNLEEMQAIQESQKGNQL